MGKIREILILIFFMIAILLFPWLSFLLIRLIATFYEIQANSVLGIFMSSVPNIFMFIIAFVFLKLDEWDFKSIGFSLSKLLPGFIFAVLALTGLYIILPFVISIFYEPQTIYVSIQKMDITYIANFIRSWVIIGVCEEIGSRGYLLNKFFSIIPTRKSHKTITNGLSEKDKDNKENLEDIDKKSNINDFAKKTFAVLFTSLFFTLVGYIRYRTAGNVNVSTYTILTIFVYGIFLSYLYLRTHNLFVAVFMQAALDFPPFGLTVGREGLIIQSFGFIFTFSLFILFVILLAETYKYWGRILEFGINRKEELNCGTEEQPEETSIN
jgi:membrane protease YdiL (CAAX protease family)